MPDLSASASDQQPPAPGPDPTPRQGPGPAPSAYTRPAPHVSDFNRGVVEEFRANGGRVGGPFAGGDLLLLTTVGARSGREHTTPLGYVENAGRLLVVGSAGGAPRHPDWYRNLLAHPMVRVEVERRSYGAVAVPAEGTARDRLFDLVVRAAPGYADYQARTARTLPVVVLERSEPEAAPGTAAPATLGAQLVRTHDWLRAQLDRVRAEADVYFAERAAPGGRGPGGTAQPVGLGLRLRQHCLAFCESVGFHHRGEDAHLLPDLERRHPQLADVIGRLREQHRALAVVRGRLEALLAEVATADPDRFRADLTRLSRELAAHLDEEETSLLPALDAVPWPPGAAGTPGDTR